MGQAFRRAVGKQRTTNVDPSSSRIQNSFDRTPPAVPDIKPQIHNNDSSPGGWLMVIPLIIFHAIFNCSQFLIN